MTSCRLHKRFVVVWTLALLAGLGFTTGCSSTPDRSATTFCRAYVDVTHAARSLGDPNKTSLDTLRTKIIQIDKAAENASAHAPKDIADAVSAVLDPLKALRHRVEAARTREQMTDAFRIYRAATAHVAARQKELDTWVASNCGFAPTPTTSTTTMNPTPSITG